MTNLTVALVTMCNDGNPMFSMSGVLFMIVRTLDIGKCKSFDLGVFDLSLFGSFISELVPEEAKSKSVIRAQMQFTDKIIHTV